MQIQPIAAHQIEAARQLLAANGWDTRVADAAVFGQLLEASSIALVAEEGGQVIGFLRALTDGIFNGYISMLAVHAGHRRRGVGRALVQAAMGSDERVTWALRAGRDGASAFWQQQGFARSTVAMERPGLRIAPLPAAAYAERTAAAARSGLHAVVYAHSMTMLAEFYRAVLGLRTLERASGFVLMAGPDHELSVVAIPGEQAVRPPPQPRQPPQALEDTPIKLSFRVPDIEALRAAVVAQGGVLKPAAAAWDWRGQRHLDAVDPEGNVFQLRQALA